MSTNVPTAALVANAAYLPSANTALTIEDLQKEFGADDGNRYFIFRCSAGEPRHARVRGLEDLTKGQADLYLEVGGGRRVDAAGKFVSIDMLGVEGRQYTIDPAHLNPATCQWVEPHQLPTRKSPAQRLIVEHGLWPKEWEVAG